MIILAFILGTIGLFFQAIFAPPFVFLAYIPWLSIASMRLKFPWVLYGAFGAGVVVDLLSDDPMGVHALNYVLVTAFLCRYRKLFSEHRVVHFGLFTWLFSFCSTILQVFLLFLFDRRIPFTGQWILGDLIVMPCIDALYALLWFHFPLLLTLQGRQVWRSIKNRLFPMTH